MISLKSDISEIKYIKNKRAKAFKKIGINTIEDLLYYFPRKYINKQNILPISLLKVNSEANFIGKIYSVKKITYNKQRLVVTLFDHTGIVNCIFFNKLSFFEKIFKTGMTLFVTGKVTFYKGKQIIHPEYQIITEKDDINEIATIVPIYPYSQELEKAYISQNFIRKSIKFILNQKTLKFNEILPKNIISSLNLLNIKEAFKQIHFPNTEEEIKKAKYRFYFQEAFLLKLILNLKYETTHKQKGIAFKESKGLLRKFVNSLPFELTKDQKQVIKDIYNDMKSPYQMNRLLQGDVGSGKTIIALISMLFAYENDYQSVLMAPTEILAEQHFLNIKEYLKNLNIKPVLLTGSLKPKAKEEVYNKIAKETPLIVVGTHAIIQEGVKFTNLGLAAIDEQHRFGVLQRGKLQATTPKPDILIMTATPIPRTLAMTLYSDLNVSIIKQLPPGRQKVETIWYPQSKIDLVYKFVFKELKSGNQIYFVYPIIEESEKMDLKACENAYLEISNIFSKYKVGLLHGKLKIDQKNNIMNAFKRKEIQILVSTTVIEVGVDVPDATVIVIEHAERFGLAQLHQLRGRVGRSNKKSYCFLVSSDKITEDGKKRLKAMTEYSSGFKIAEIDMEIRGPGNILGTLQAGLPNIKFMEILSMPDLLDKADFYSKKIINKDPQLLLPEHENLRKVLLEKYKNKIDFLSIG